MKFHVVAGHREHLRKPLINWLFLFSALRIVSGKLTIPVHQSVHQLPLVDAVDSGVVLSTLLSACVRASLQAAPGTVRDAPTAGTGKTLLRRAVGALALGYAPPVLPPASNKDEEVRKRLFAALRDGHRVPLWDNVREPLGNAALDAFLTASTFTDRIWDIRDSYFVQPHVVSSDREQPASRRRHLPAHLAGPP